MSDNFGIAFGKQKGCALLPLGIIEGKKEFFINIVFSTTSTSYYADNDYRPLIIGLNEYKKGKGISFELCAQKGKALVYTRGFAETSEGKYVFDTGKTIGDGKIHNIVLQSDGTSVVATIDGESIQTGLAIKSGVALPTDYPMCIANNRPGNPEIAADNMVLYELKVYDANTTDDSHLKAWYSPTIEDVKAHTLLDKSGNANDAAIEKTSDYDYRIERAPITYIDNGEEKQYTFSFFPYKNKGMLYPHKRQNDKTISTTGFSFSGRNDIVLPYGVREFWVRFDAYLPAAGGSWEVSAPNGKWRTGVSTDYILYSSDIDKWASSVKSQMAGKHSYVLHVLGGKNNSGLIEVFMDGKSEPFTTRTGDFLTKDDDAKYIVFDASGAEFSDVIISENKIDVNDHSTDPDTNVVKIGLTVHTGRRVEQQPAQDVGIVFNGTDNYLKCGYLANNNTKFIFDMVFSTTESRSAESDGSMPSLFSVLGGQANGTFNLGINGGNLCLRSGLNDSMLDFDSKRKINDGNKHHVRLLSDGAKLYIYLDGEEIDTGLPVTRALDEKWDNRGEDGLCVGFCTGKNICTKLVLYEFKAYRREENEDFLEAWYKPDKNYEGLCNLIRDLSESGGGLSLKGNDYKIVENGVEKSVYALPYTNSGYGEKSQYTADKNESATGRFLKSLTIPVSDDCNEVWVRLDAYARNDEWHTRFNVFIGDENDQTIKPGFYYDWTWDKPTVYVGNGKSWYGYKIPNGNKHSFVFHFKLGENGTAVSEYCMDSTEPTKYQRAIGSTDFKGKNRYVFLFADELRLSDIVVSESELTINDHCTDTFDASRVTTTAVALRTLGYTSEQEIPTSRRITYQYETKDTYSTMRRLSAAVTEQFATEREVWSPYVYIRDAIDAVRVIQRSFGFNVRTERNTLKDAKNDRASKKHVTLENLRMFLSCCDERFVQQKPGFGLSSNDFTDKYKERIRSIEEDAEKNTVIGISVDDLDLDIPKSRVINLGAITEDDILSLANEVFGKI